MSDINVKIRVVAEEAKKGAGELSKDLKGASAEAKDLQGKLDGVGSKVDDLDGKIRKIEGDIEDLGEEGEEVEDTFESLFDAFSHADLSSSQKQLEGLLHRLKEFRKNSDMSKEQEVELGKYAESVKQEVKLRQQGIDREQKLADAQIKEQERQATEVGKARYAAIEEDQKRTEQQEKEARKRGLIEDAAYQEDKKRTEKSQKEAAKKAQEELKEQERQQKAAQAMGKTMEKALSENEKFDKIKDIKMRIDTGEAVSSLKDLQERIDYLKKALSVSGGSNKLSPEQFQDYSNKLKEYQTQLNPPKVEDNSATELLANLKLLQGALGSVSKACGKIGDAGIAAFKAMASGAKSALSAVGTLGEYLKDIAMEKISPLTDAFSAVKNKFSDFAKNWEKNLAKIAKTGVFMVVRKAFTALLSGIGDAVNSLAQYSNSIGGIEGKFNGAMSSITSGSRTMVANLVAAFEPILSAIVPILETLINWITAALQKVNEFLSALFGFASFTTAKSTKSNYADSLNSSGGSGSSSNSNSQYEAQVTGLDEANVLATDSTNGLTASLDAEKKSAVEAARALKKYNTFALGIDELNVMNVPESSSSGGGGSSASPIEWEENPISDAMQELADKFKDFWDKFTKPFKDAWDKVGDYVKSAWNYMCRQLKKLGKDVYDDFMTVWGQAKTEEIFEMMLDSVGDIFVSIGNLAYQFDKAWEHGKVGLHIFEDIRDIIWELVNDFNRCTEYLKTWTKHLDFYPMLESFENLLSDLVPVADTVGDIFYYGFTQGVLKFYKFMIEDELPAINDAIDNVINKIDLTKLYDNAKNIIDAVETFMENFESFKTNVLESAGLAIGEFLNSEEFASFTEQLKWVSDNIPWDSLAGIFGDIANGLEAVAEAVAGFVGGQEFQSFLEAIFGIIDKIDDSNVITNIFKAIGGAITDIASALAKFTSSKAFTDFMSAVIDFLSSITASQVEGVIKGLAIAIGLFKFAEFTSAGVSGFLSVLSAIKVFAPAAGFSSLPELFSALAGGIGAVAGPIAIVVGAVAALVTGFVTCYNESATFREKVSEAVGKIKESFADLKESFQPIIDGLGPLLDIIIEIFGAISLDVLQDVADRIAIISDTIVAINDALFGLAQVLGGIIEGVTTGDFSSVAAGFDTWGDSLSHVAEVVEDVKGSFLDFTPENMLGKAEDWLTVASEIGDTVKGAFDKSTQEAASSVKTTSDNTVNELKNNNVSADKVKSGLSGIGEGTSQAMDVAGENVKTKKDTILEENKLTEEDGTTFVQPALDGASTTLNDGITTEFETLNEQLDLNYETLWTTFTEKYFTEDFLTESLFTPINTAFTTFWDTISTLINENYTTWFNAFTEKNFSLSMWNMRVFNKVKLYYRNWWSEMMTLIEGNMENDLWTGIICKFFAESRWQPKFVNLKNMWQNAFRQICQIITQYFDETFSHFDTLCDNLGNKLDSLISKVRTLSSELDALSSKAGSINLNFGGSAMADGGFLSQGDIFVANEAGPELIGTIGGRTAVASNNEITGIRDAVIASGDAQIGALQSIMNYCSAILDKDTGVYIGDREIALAARSGSDALGVSIIS